MEINFTSCWLGGPDGRELGPWDMEYIGTATTIDIEYMGTVWTMNHEIHVHSLKL